MFYEETCKDIPQLLPALSSFPSVCQTQPQAAKVAKEQILNTILDILRCTSGKCGKIYTF